MNAEQRDLRDPRECDTRRIFIGGDFFVKTSLFICALKTSQGAEAPLFFVFAVLGGADEQRAIRAVSACNTRASIRAIVFGGAHAFPCSPLPTSTETEGRRSQIFCLQTGRCAERADRSTEYLESKRGRILRDEYWEIIADNLSKPVGVGAALQPWIPTGERSSLLTHVATMESVSLCERMKS